MIRSARTKRRKIKYEIDIIIESNLYETNNYEVLKYAENEMYNKSEIKSNVSHQSINNDVSSTNFSSTLTVKADFENIILPQDTIFSEIPTLDKTVSEQNNIHNSRLNNLTPDFIILDFLSNWATTF